MPLVAKLSSFFLSNPEIDFNKAYCKNQKSHYNYISVEKNNGVILKGTPIPSEKADALVLKKARWIFDRLELVRAVGVEGIVIGSRIPYLGRKYYTLIFYNQQLEQVEIEFNQS